MSLFKRVAPLLLFPLVVALGACSSTKPKFQDDQLFSNSSGPFARNFDFASTDACEAARRALLSQGYMTTMTRNDTVDASKNFQPASDSHIVVEVHVVCTAGDASNTSVVYVNAVQNGYALKKSDTSASVGLSIFGSLSLPIRSNSDAMVKISSETIQSGSFYDRFFDLVTRYLRTSARSEPVPGQSGAIQITPLPPPVSPAPAVAVVTPQTPAAALASRSVAPIVGVAAGLAEVNTPVRDDSHGATPTASAITANAATQTPATNDGHNAAPLPALAAETTTALQPVAGTTGAGLLPGIGEPPMLTAPATLATRTVAPAPTSAQASAGEALTAPAATANATTTAATPTPGPSATAASSTTP